MLKKIRKKIKSHDEFGKEISFNIDGEESHKTWFGGMLSVVITCLMIVYVVLLFKKMAFHEEDILNYKYPDLPLEEIGEVSYKETYEMIFF